ncbi:hypothetical protein PY650_28765 [Rhizobium calliandrae]|uniref:Uncharacterized protein n=1 Tax=Rhizobium calliandrae TaxID=1312182 RepID=A0ABT7KLP2_9HYPH|nr:hypothetical protein [Rhizobium calliandrae]MDL2409551.1 hypothetical protein [Rhizobium calliandrae]
MPDAARAHAPPMRIGEGVGFKVEHYREIVETIPKTDFSTRMENYMGPGPSGTSRVLRASGLGVGPACVKNAQPAMREATARAVLHGRSAGPQNDLCNFPSITEAHGGDCAKVRMSLAALYFS